MTPQSVTYASMPFEAVRRNGQDRSETGTASRNAIGRIDAPQVTLPMIRQCTVSAVFARRANRCDALTNSVSPRDINSARPVGRRYIGARSILEYRSPTLRCGAADIGGAGPRQPEAGARRVPQYGADRRSPGRVSKSILRGRLSETSHDGSGHRRARHGIADSACGGYLHGLLFG